MRLDFTRPALLALLVASPLQAAQTIGTDPSAESRPEAFRDEAGYAWQTFTATGDYLSSFSFWFDGGAVATDDSERQFVGVDLLEYGDAFGRVLYEWNDLDEAVSGRYDLFYGAVALSRGETYALRFHRVKCGDLTWCPSHSSQPVTGTDRPITLETTTSDAYSGGDWYVSTDGPTDYDLRFEITFVSVPEPGTLLLLTTGLGLMAMVRRRSPIGASARRGKD